MRQLALFTIASILLVAGFLATPRSEALAAASISLSPASGTFSQNIFVDVVVANTGTAVVGYDIEINFTGPVDFQSYSAGTLGCGELLVKKESAGKVSLLCLASLSSGTLPNSGAIAKVVFKTTGNGSVAMTVANNDDSVDITSMTGSNYTIANYVASGIGAGTGAALPQTSFLDENPALLGFVALIMGIGTLLAFKRYDRFNSDEQLSTVASMSDKVRNY